MSWPKVKLSDVAQINPRCPKEIDGEQLVSFVAMASASEDGKLLSEEIKVLDETKKGFTYFERGDVLLAKITPCFENGKCLRPNQISKTVGFGSTEFHVLRANEEKLDSSYLFYMVWSKAFRFLGEHSMSGAAGQKRVGADFIKAYEIPLPPLEEQKRIAAILDKADSVRRKRQQAIDLADDFLRSVFLDMFGDPVTNPKGWDVELLGEHIQHANNGLSRRRKIEENIGDIVLRLQDVHYEGIRFGKELNRIELEDKEKSRYRLDIGDLLFIRVNGNPEYVGRSAVFEGFNEEVFHNDHLIRIKVKDSFNSRFLSYMLNLPGGKKIISSKTKTSAGQHTISQGGIESLEFIVPPIDLQNKFVNIQSTVNKQLNKQSVSFIELTHSFSSLSQKAFAGEL